MKYRYFAQIQKFGQKSKFRTIPRLTYEKFFKLWFSRRGNKPPPRDYASSSVTAFRSEAPTRKVGASQNYHISITTGDKRFGGTSRNVTMVFTDITGYVFEPVVVENNGSIFGRNTTYEKKITLTCHKSNILNKNTKFKEWLRRIIRSF